MSLEAPSETLPAGKHPERYLGFSTPYNCHATWNKKSVLYFISCGDLVKIGIANDLEKRLTSLRAGNPEGLEVAAWRTVPRPLRLQVERRMHEHFAHLGVGREWFRGLDMPAALKVAATHIRHANLAMHRWTADGHWRDEWCKP